jgi:hypothetical protein
MVEESGDPDHHLLVDDPCPVDFFEQYIIAVANLPVALRPNIDQRLVEGAIEPNP